MGGISRCGCRGGLPAAGIQQQSVEVAVVVAVGVAVVVAVGVAVVVAVAVAVVVEVAVAVVVAVVVVVGYLLVSFDVSGWLVSGRDASHCS